MKHQLGLTLLEVSIAMSIGMAILLLGIKSVEYLNRYNATHEVKSEIVLLRLALEDYYFSHCSEDSFPVPTISNLKRDKYLTTQFNADNDFGSDYAISIDVKSTPPTYKIKLTLNAGLDADVYRQRLGATDIGEDTKPDFTWKEDYLKGRGWSEKEKEQKKRNWINNYLRTRSYWVKKSLKKQMNIGTKIIKDLSWVYPLSITRQYHDHSLGRFKRFYGEKLC